MNKTPYFVYLLKCGDGTLYTGITTDVARRFAEHQKGIGSHYTRAKGVVAMVYQEEVADRGAASRCEALIKRMTREEKLALIALQERKTTR
ncbi:hypothetical protein A3C89_01305 [Candidatus Kaiserbacteria bacterium RIFCSPHIGHO2_02_FULL_50_50]|uniref:GIY-YIG domain-containing protein n=1 Tax=Candidatus Kaiserbacteria bacterium RIFCSPHIGHO2_02_FULL_50_50 TaxID=1798492 RepID=A0A1F6DGF1_9BACT|nr:MAG: hypothetical protein A3C89_01305 [Candidatus Kaiserbacteria bacterium RIFCSPHIGHO2_02_FULL_50_50]OGG88934.1 MAG: hypothetical protein A3G62_02860 [Candidatus Kaiserbacteria bacterium RIFCSPLOWO2_12_FULL_50_10]